jgi:cytochrome c oxidase cbb3-type subunit 3
MSNGWSLFIIILVVAHIIGYSWLLFSTSRMKQENHKEGETTGHTWDDDLTEYNNPLPKWWLYMFILTIVFAVVYLVLYPGLGNYKGTLNWSQVGQWENENAKVTETRNEYFSTFINLPIAEMIHPIIDKDGNEDNRAMEVGERLFANHCSTCHGSDAQGAIGFPNLADKDWLYGGTPEQIVASITNGRNGVMPPWGAALGEEGVNQVAAYIRSFNKEQPETKQTIEGKNKFDMFCVACHGADGSGNQLLGAPNLTDNIWLHASNSNSHKLEAIIMEGVSAKMPAHSAILDENNIKVIAAYVYSLSNK